MTKTVFNIGDCVIVTAGGYGLSTLVAKQVCGVKLYIESIVGDHYKFSHSVNGIMNSLLQAENRHFVFNGVTAEGLSLANKNIYEVGDIFSYGGDNTVSNQYKLCAVGGDMFNFINNSGINLLKSPMKSVEKNSTNMNTNKVDLTFIMDIHKLRILYRVRDLTVSQTFITHPIPK